MSIASRPSKLLSVFALGTFLSLGASITAQGQQLGLGNQMLPGYAAPSYSPVFPSYHPAPVIGGFAQSPSYALPEGDQSNFTYQPTPQYPQYLAPGANSFPGALPPHPTVYPPCIGCPG